MSQPDKTTQAAAKSQGMPATYKPAKSEKQTNEERAKAHHSEKQKQVIATELGFHKRLLHPGDVFWIGESKTGEWFKDFDPKEKIEPQLSIQQQLAAPGSSKQSAPGTSNAVAEEWKNFGDPNKADPGIDELIG